jgi:methionyl-tRNA formyltransferase
VTGARLLVATMDGVEEGELEPRPQPADGVSFAPKLTPDDAHLDWKSPALHIDRLVRACTPAPGAWTTFRGDRLKIGPVRPRPDEPPLAPGRLKVTKTAALVGTGTHPVALGEVQPPGKQPMAAADWARGVRPADEDTLI